MPMVKGSNAGKHLERPRKMLREDSDEGRGQLYLRKTIGILPDDILLEIFNSYVYSQAYDEDVWHTLIHVCQRWRWVVFASPRRLNLQLLCTNTRPVEKMLDIWPVLPICIFARTKSSLPLTRMGVTNILSALQQHDRVCEIRILAIPNSLLKSFAAMNVPFPALTDLELSSEDENPPILPSSFLGGSAPRLRSLSLSKISIPTLRKLVLSTHNLVYLSLWNIPHSGYISTEEMVACLSALTRLYSLMLGFRYPRSWADRSRRHPPPPTRVVLPALTHLNFHGDSEYLEDIVSRIDTPLFEVARITFFNQLVLHTPRLRHFFNRTETFKKPLAAYIGFYDDHVDVTLSREDTRIRQMLELEISCRPSDWQLSSIAQAYSSALSPLQTLESLDIFDHREHWKDDIENAQWLELLRLFTSVKYLELSKNLVPLVASALQELTGGSVTDFLPALQNLSLRGPQLSGPVNEAIEKFITERRRSGRPVVIHHSE